MCCLQNIDLRDYQENVTDGQTDKPTDRRRTKWSLCVAMLRSRHKYLIGRRIWPLWITVDGLNFVGYQFSWFSWRVWSTNSSTHEIVILCMNYERNYFGHEFWSSWKCHFCSIHENWYPQKIKPSTVVDPEEHKKVNPNVWWVLNFDLQSTEL